MQYLVSACIITFWYITIKRSNEKNAFMLQCKIKNLRLIVLSVQSHAMNTIG